MTMDSSRPTASSTEDDHFLCHDWFDTLDAGVRVRSATAPASAAMLANNMRWAIAISCPMPETANVGARIRTRSFNSLAVT